MKIKIQVNCFLLNCGTAIVLNLFSQNAVSAEYTSCKSNSVRLALTEPLGYGANTEEIFTQSIITLPICRYDMNFVELTKNKRDNFSQALLNFYTGLFEKKSESLVPYLSVQDLEQKDAYIKRFELISKNNPVLSQTYLYSALENQEGVSFFIELRDQKGQKTAGPLAYGFTKENASKLIFGPPKGLAHELYFHYLQPSKKGENTSLTHPTHKLELEKEVNFYFKVLDTNGVEFKNINAFLVKLVQSLKQKNLNEFYNLVSPESSWRTTFEKQGEPAVKLSADYYQSLKIIAVIEIDPLLIAYASSSRNVINSVMRFRKTARGYQLINENKYDLSYKIYTHEKLKAGALEATPFASLKCAAVSPCL